MPIAIEQGWSLPLNKTEKFWYLSLIPLGYPFHTKRYLLESKIEWRPSNLKLGCLQVVGKASDGGKPSKVHNGVWCLQSNKELLLYSWSVTLS